MSVLTIINQHNKTNNYSPAAAAARAAVAGVAGVAQNLKSRGGYLKIKFFKWGPLYCFLLLKTGKMKTSKGKKNNISSYLT